MRSERNSCLCHELVHHLQLGRLELVNHLPRQTEVRTETQIESGLARIWNPSKLGADRQHGDAASQSRQMQNDTARSKTTHTARTRQKEGKDGQQRSATPQRTCMLSAIWRLMVSSLSASHARRASATACAAAATAGSAVKTTGTTNGGNARAERADGCRIRHSATTAAWQSQENDTGNRHREHKQTQELNEKMPANRPLPGVHRCRAVAQWPPEPLRPRPLRRPRRRQPCRPCRPSPDRQDRSRAARSRITSTHTDTEHMCEAITMRACCTQCNVQRGSKQQESAPRRRE